MCGHKQIGIWEMSKITVRPAAEPTLTCKGYDSGDVMGGTEWNRNLPRVQEVAVMV